MKSRVGVMALITLAAAGPAYAQSGNGETGAAVLTLPAGSRAPAMAGAYTAARDVDVLFYNPAGAAWLRGGVSAAYERRVSDVGYASIAAAAGIGRATVGLAIGHIDFGTIDEVVPDPEFSGQRGQLTGETVNGGEGVARLMAAVPLFGGRAAIGAGAGVLYTSLAETGRAASLFDLGLQYRPRSDLTIGASLRNIGADVEGARMAAAPLPRELRIGVGHGGFVTPLHPAAEIRLQGDLVSNLETGGWAAAAGTEIDVAVAGAISAAVRAGFDGSNGAGGLGRFHFGAGLTRAGLGLDYSLQHMGPLGTVHRFGLRWSRERPLPDRPATDSGR